MSSNPDEALRFGALTPGQVAALDAAAAEIGVNTMQLMEVAGWQVARCSWRMLGEQEASVFVVAGRGNNGGDALVAARHLATWGCLVTGHVLAREDQLADVLAAHIRSARSNGVSVAVGPELPAIPAGAEPALLLDGILGTGLRAAPRGPQAAAIRALNSAGVQVLAIDVPSGLDAGTGEPYVPCVRAAATCTLAGMKAGLWGAGAYAGDLWVADIGMPAAAWRACGLSRPVAVRGGALVPVPASTRTP